MKIMPCVSAGIVFLREDGTIEMPAFQVFRLRDGATCIRIGRNTLWFEKDGAFDGTECRATGLDMSPGQEQALVAAFERSTKNRGQRPDTAYFASDSIGYEAEVSGWPPSATPEEVH